MRKQIVSTISIGGEEFEGVSELLDDGFRFYRFTGIIAKSLQYVKTCLLYTSPSPRDRG